MGFEGFDEGGGWTLQWWVRLAVVRRMFCMDEVVRVRRNGCVGDYVDEPVTDMYPFPPCLV